MKNTVPENKEPPMLDIYAGNYLRMDFPDYLMKNMGKENVKIHVHQIVGEKEVEYMAFVENNDEGILTRIHAGKVAVFPEENLDKRIARDILNSKDFHSAFVHWLTSHTPLSAEDLLGEENIEEDEDLGEDEELDGEVMEEDEDEDDCYIAEDYWLYPVLQALRKKRPGEQFQKEIPLNEIISTIIPQQVELTQEQQMCLLNAVFAHLNKCYRGSVKMSCLNVFQQGKNTIATIKGKTYIPFKHLADDVENIGEECDCAFDYWASYIYDLALDRLSKSEKVKTLMGSDIFNEFIPSSVNLTTQQKETIIRQTLAYMEEIMDDFS